MKYRPDVPLDIHRIDQHPELFEPIHSNEYLSGLKDAQPSGFSLAACNPDPQKCNRNSSHAANQAKR